MIVIRARVLGFCMGVRRAVEMALEAGKDGLVYSMGPLIHNPQVLASLKEQGLEILDEGALPPDLEGLTVILRAHGVSPALEAELIRRHAVLADATCPLVKKNQLKARSLAEAGFFVFIAGEKHHGEVAGLHGYAPCGIVVAESAEAAQAARVLAQENPAARTALIGQTTIDAGEYGRIGEAIRLHFPALEVVDSICPATREWQDALRELCSRVDAVVVAGGRCSSNTRRLLDIALSLGKPARLVESAAEIDVSWAAGYRTIGLSAGASTPDSGIAEIESALAGL
ncbi:MAG: 4-hydroxy-3-methylbut-2-enyl diphosphate reductase [Treponema sp.]|jgi:4-hydroxy-3-methylbut-2-enyl diphosphate reductase|nr:4-hydroxy-3-methylbut-2-enyl diphosphate reductase [Treponema sp.]